MDPRTSYLLPKHFNFGNIVFYILKFWKSQMLEKTGTEQSRKSVQKSWKSWRWDQYLPENMTWKFGIFETKKSQNHETIKL